MVVIVSAYIGVGEDHFVKGVVRTDNKGGAEVRGESQTGVAAGLDHTLLLPLPCENVPFVHCTINTAADDTGIIWTPLDAAHLYPSTHTHILYMYVLRCFNTTVCQIHNHMYRYVHVRTCIMYLSIVAFQIPSILKGEGGEELNEVGIGCSKQVATVTK